MSTETTRREFLRTSALGLAATATAVSPFVANAEAGRPGQIMSWVTNEKVRFQRREPIRWRSASGVPTKEAIVLNAKEKFQEILGFGSAFTDSACFMLNQLSAPAREELFHSLFHPSEMNLNVCRTCIGSSDYSTKVYSYDEGEPDPGMERFSIEHDREYILPVLREARKANPDLFLFSSPWSPPGWMKSGGSMLGGSMRRRYLHPYAQYFLRFLRAYSEAGVPIQAVTPQNEVDTDQDGRMPACIWPQEYEIEFVRDHLGPLLEQNGIPTKIWILDHNYNLWGRAICELDDPGLRKYCNAVAWHGYVGTPEMMSKVHSAHRDAGMYWTEGGSDYTSPDYLTDWAKWGGTFTQVLRNWCRSITGWNLALDEQGRPNIGPFPCGGLVTIHSQTKEITRSGQYWAFAHFSRVIQRGARRFDSQGTPPGVEHVAFENPGGQRVLVVTNTGPDRPATLSIADWETRISLDKDSVTSLVWS
ncbi:MAG TPA: glycoside hydrolase family 30 beta sandwich domain-containing protein [Terriglobales bacterium]|jgi:glucosylceramidase|nr:glycoside hydrolase family 30 beta sandwich domain-containing protein [Terriglobales bacterium]